MVRLAGNRPEIAPLVTLNNLTITGGANPTGCGGGLVNDHGNLALNRVTIHNNTAVQGAGMCNLGSGGTGPASLALSTALSALTQPTVRAGAFPTLVKTTVQRH